MDELPAHKPLVALDQPGEHGVRLAVRGRLAGGRPRRGKREPGRADRQSGDSQKIAAGQMAVVQVVHESLLALWEALRAWAGVRLS